MKNTPDLSPEMKIRFDELIEPEFNYPRDFDENRLLKFLELAGPSKSVKTESILINLGVAKKQEGKLLFNNAGVLFKDYGGADIIDRKEIEGSLFEIVEEGMKFVWLYSKVAYRFTGMPQRENIYEYPFRAMSHPSSKI